MKLPHNKYTLFAAAWFVLLWAALLRESGGHTPPPFPHFDKAARAWLEDGRRPPYLPLAAAALLLATATEAAQAWFTAHRSGDLLDALADLAGTALALLLARQVCRNRRGM